MNKSFIALILIFLASCGRDSTQRKDILSLNEYVSEEYTLSYHRFNSQYHFEGSMLVVGAGVHLKLKTNRPTNGYLYLTLHSAHHCQEDFSSHQIMWNLNNDFYRNTKFDNGYVLETGKIKESFDYHLLMKFLRRPKKGFYTLEEGERLNLSSRTLLFYYSNATVVSRESMILLGCAEFHST